MLGVSFIFAAAHQSDSIQLEDGWSLIVSKNIFTSFCRALIVSKNIFTRIFPGAAILFTNKNKFYSHFSWRCHTFYK